jgi:predicted DNA-binding protein (UPF0251 family)
MPRPRKFRRVEHLPGVTYFKPAGIPLRVLEEVHLSVEEAEAIRLKDMEGLEQEECAGRMSVSRSTFQRILSSGRQKIAEALLGGKAIRIEGGRFEIAGQRYKCLNGHEWEVPFEEIAGTPPELCPECDTSKIEPLPYRRPGK